MKRPILVAIIGYIIGILWGLYFKLNIVLFYFIIIASYFSLNFVYKKYLNHKKNKLKIFSFKRYFRYVKIIITHKVIILIIFFSIISNVIINIKEGEFEKIYNSPEDFLSDLVCVVEGKKEEKEYYDCYIIKVIKSNTNKQFEQKKIYAYIKKSNYKSIIDIGDILQISGKYIRPNKMRNYGGYDEQKYLKTKKIYGKLNISNLKVLEKEKENLVMRLSNRICSKIEDNIDIVFDKQGAQILKGVLLGDDSGIDEEVKENFQDSSILHILAVSGMHINYLVLGSVAFFKKIIGKRYSKIVTIIILIIYMFVSGFSPSVVRATIMGVLFIISSLVHRKNDIWTSLSISLFIIVIYNPYLIMNVGLQFTYFGTIGIVMFNKMFFEILDNKKRVKEKCKGKKYEKLKKKAKEFLSVILAAQITILPLNIYYFNSFNPYFIISNFFTSIIICPVIIFGFSFIFFSFIFMPVSKLISLFVKMGICIIIFISEMGNLPFSKIYLPTFRICYLIVYVLFIVIFKNLYFIYNSKQITTTQKRIRNIVSLLKYKMKINSMKLKTISTIFLIIIIIFTIVPKNLKIYFVDVGQGDCTFIVTPNNQTILIDGGGNESGSFDVGKNILIPYILDRGYTKIDYIIVSHFDSDHFQGCAKIMEELQVKTVIISKQVETSENYEKFKEIVKNKKIKVIVVGEGDRINIENDFYFDILWPKKSKVISENTLNNNSIVCKLNYKNFSVMFTGDIEDIAEKKILESYSGRLQIFDSTILKVGHHGSKTSSSQEFLNTVKPQIALIGVGENNKFGHPNSQVVERLEKLRNKNI